MVGFYSKPGGERAEILLQKSIFIKGGKEKKDRYSVLSDKMIALLRQYLAAYTPAYWLFEGQSGGQYSTRSIQQVFRKAVQADREWGTLIHTDLNYDNL